MDNSLYSPNGTFNPTGFLEQVQRKREDVLKSKMNLFWAVCNFIMAFGVLFEMSFGEFVFSWSYSSTTTWSSVLAVVVIFSIASFIYFLRYMRYWLTSSPLELTVSQQKLFGVYDNEPGFRIIKSVSEDTTRLKTTSGPTYSPSVYTGRSPLQCSPSRAVHWFDQSSARLSPGAASTRLSPAAVGPFSSPSSLGSRQGSVHSTPSSYSNAASPHSGSPGYILGGSGGRSSPSGCPRVDTSTGSVGASFNSSSLLANQSTSSAGIGGNTSATFQRNVLAEINGLKSKSHRPSRSPTVSPLRTDNCIQDLNSLDSYLREQQEKESKPITDLTASPSPGHSFWSYGRLTDDMLPVLRHYQYQIAPRNTLSTTGNDDSSSQTDSPSCEHVWTKLGVTSDQVDRWVENLRKWLGKTILSRLVSEIDEVNKLLVRQGSDDVQIGEASLSTLKQLSTVKSQHIPQLMALIPYIDMSPNQEYLVQRIRELANGGCISAFKWNGGAEFKGKRWEETLPTDSAILIHLLCSYLDTRLPAHPKYPDGKTFTSQHFIKTPDKPNLSGDRKNNLCIYQTQLIPPHYKVVIEDTVWNVKEGRHNLFHAILLFLYHIQTKEHGTLRRINLGMSGINIAWIFEM